MYYRNSSAVFIHCPICYLQPVLILGTSILFQCRYTILFFGCTIFILRSAIPVSSLTFACWLSFHQHCYFIFHLSFCAALPISWMRILKIYSSNHNCCRERPLENLETFFRINDNQIGIHSSKILFQAVSAYLHRSNVRWLSLVALHLRLIFNCWSICHSCQRIRHPTTPSSNFWEFLSLDHQFDFIMVLFDNDLGQSLQTNSLVPTRIGLCFLCFNQLE
jgi:hypothetical protein